jgi:hypothetical protein
MKAPLDSEHIIGSQEVMRECNAVLATENVYFIPLRHANLSIERCLRSLPNTHQLFFSAGNAPFPTLTILKPLLSSVSI